MGVLGELLRHTLETLMVLVPTCLKNHWQQIMTKIIMFDLGHLIRLVELTFFKSSTREARPYRASWSKTDHLAGHVHVRLWKL